MKKVAVFLWLGLLVSCRSGPEQEAAPEDKFVWDVQFAGYDHDRTDPKGEVTYDDFLAEFVCFPWIEQIEEANLNPDKVSPTLTVTDKLEQKDFFISMAGDRYFQEYYLGYIYLKEIRWFLGFGPRRSRWLEVYRTTDIRVVRELIRAFFDRDYSTFESVIQGLTFEGEMRPADLAK